jgi:hypothetical protein
MHDPHPPVSGPPQPIGPGGSSGPRYGSLSKAKWAVGDVTEKEIITVTRADLLWRVSVFGPVLLRVDYGTTMRRQFALLRAPLVMTLPGQVFVYAAPVSDQHTGIECTATLTAASSGARAICRHIVTSLPGAVALNNDAVSYFALTASTLTIAGFAVVVPALSAVPLVSGSVLNTGSGYEEFEA